MNYWERHIGDYARDAGHLSMLEHGAYTMLLDRYYSTERAIPADQAHRICRARTKEERAAVDAVLNEFFTLTDGLWVNGRAEREVAKAQTKIEAARTNGARGGRPKKNPEGTQQKPTGLSVGSVLETQKKALQTPDTRHQTTSVANATGAQAPPDPADSIFALGVPMLTAAGVSERNSRSMLGLMRKTHGDTAVVGALQRCAEERPLQPVAWLQAALKAPVTKPDRVANTSVAETAEYLRQQAAHKAERPPPEVMAKLKGVIRSVA